MLASIRPVGVECGTHRCRGLWGCSRHVVTSVCLRGGAVGGLSTVAIVVGVVLGVVIGAVVKAVGGSRGGAYGPGRRRRGSRYNPGAPAD